MIQRVKDWLSCRPIKVARKKICDREYVSRRMEHLHQDYLYFLHRQHYEAKSNIERLYCSAMQLNLIKKIDWYRKHYTLWSKQSSR